MLHQKDAPIRYIELRFSAVKHTYIIQYVTRRMQSTLNSRNPKQIFLALQNRHKRLLIPFPGITFSFLSNGVNPLPLKDLTHNIQQICWKRYLHYFFFSVRKGLAVLDLIVQGLQSDTIKYPFMVLVLIQMLRK